jgi:hypothetical protein
MKAAGNLAMIRVLLVRTSVWPLSQTKKGGKMFNTVEDDDGQWYMTWGVN